MFCGPLGFGATCVVGRRPGDRPAPEVPTTRVFLDTILSTMAVPLITDIPGPFLQT